MALFKVTTKRLLLSGGKRLEAGMTAEVSFNGSTLPFANSTVKAEIQRQFKMKYNVNFPVGYMNGNELKVEKTLTLPANLCSDSQPLAITAFHYNKL